MKNKINLKVVVAAACIGATMSTNVMADSLLAPLVISDLANGFETIVNAKVRGNGTPDADFAPADITDLHYTYLKKGTNPADLRNFTKGCTHINGSGRVSSWDMVNHTINPTLDVLAKPVGTDASLTFSPLTPFYGMMIMDDIASLGTEGNMSGFVHVMNYVSGTMLDYKLLNNHKSAVSGDFSAGFVRNTSADFAWNPVARDVTAWLAVATGVNMTTGPWNATLRISQDTNVALGNSSPTVPHDDTSIPSQTGVYDNDENNVSGDTPVDVTCMAIVDRNDIMSPTQESLTRNGGWVRKSLIGGAGSTGGLVYKMEVNLLMSALTGTTAMSFQPETAGHLAAGNEHPNRPY